MAETRRLPLYDRLPEIYRVEDAKQSPPYPLRSFLGLVEGVFGEIQANIESLYHDLFIETCDDWVVPYLTDLVGTSHLAGDPWTLRADVANTIALRRRKGTLGAIELLTFSLTRWGVHAVELRRNLAWAQHLNHQRPDAGGLPPQLEPGVDRHTPVRGGSVVVRDPSTLSLLATPFDPFGHLPDVKPPAPGAVRYNLPNLAVFLWRLAAYTVPISRPVPRSICPTGEAAPLSTHNVHFEVDPLAERLRLFNVFEFDPDRRPPVVTDVDRTPGPIHPARLDSPGPAGAGGAPRSYVHLELYEPGDLSTIELTEHALQLHIPRPGFFPFDPEEWTFRGADLSNWEASMGRPLAAKEIAIDPRIGRLAIGTESAGQATSLRDDLLVTYTYGAVGPVGAHPISRSGEPPTVVVTLDGATTLADALANLPGQTAPVVVEIADSRVHELDLAAVVGTGPAEDGGPNLRLTESLTIRAADGQRPIVRLARPLRFRPAEVVAASPALQPRLDARNGRLTVRLEGLFLTRGAGFPAGEPLIARAAVHSLELYDSTLDPGGRRQLDDTRAPNLEALELRHPYGFGAVEEDAFRETPEIHLRRTVAGRLRIDREYRLFLTESIVDAGSGVGEDPATAEVAVSGPETHVDRVTLFGRMRVERLAGRGGIWAQRLEVVDDQVGCVRTSYFSGLGDRLPQNQACVRGPEAFLRFTSEIFGEPAYGQIALASDFRIRERGPEDDAMGAFGFLLGAHKWRNLQIRYREFMPVGVRPLLVPVT